MRDEWDISLMDGIYYELAYHDYTQPIKMCSCERSVKTVNLDSNPRSISDLFSLRCGGTNQISHLFFNETGEPGILSGKCTFSPTGTCPDYVIDVGTRTPGEPYPWVLEFQCVEDANTGKLLFAGVNFYSRVVSNESFTEMFDSATSHGLMPFINGGTISLKCACLHLR